MGIIGATIMPHVIYLHSSLHKGRIRSATKAERQAMLRANKWDCIIGLGIAGLANLAILCVAAALFRECSERFTQKITR